MDEAEVVCTDCETVPVLVETPYREHTEYVVQCDCTDREIDVSSNVASNSLTEPITGKWSNFDVGNPNR